MQKGIKIRYQRGQWSPKIPTRGDSTMGGVDMVYGAMCYPRRKVAMQFH